MLSRNKKEKQLLEVGDIITNFGMRMKDVDHCYTEKELNNTQIVIEVLVVENDVKEYKFYPLNDFVSLGAGDNSNYKYCIWRRREGNHSYVKDR